MIYIPRGASNSVSQLMYAIYRKRIALPLVQSTLVKVSVFIEFCLFFYNRRCIAHKSRPV